MNVRHVKAIIERAATSISANSKDLPYKEALQKKIDDLKNKLCSDQEVKTFDDLKDYHEVSTHLATLADELQQSI
ncbi:MAG: hypothetical protein WC875_01840 [Candidatus Absconditabacterales bacterium]|jgi:hypothetical protein